MFSNLPVNTNRYPTYFFAPDKHKSEYFCFSNSGHNFFFFVQNVHQRQAAQSQGWFKLSWVEWLPSLPRNDSTNDRSITTLDFKRRSLQFNALSFCFVIPLFKIVPTNKLNCRSNSNLKLQFTQVSTKHFCLHSIFQLFLYQASFDNHFSTYSFHTLILFL
jgi:hypothetical protein